MASVAGRTKSLPPSALTAMRKPLSDEEMEEWEEVDVEVDPDFRVIWKLPLTQDEFAELDKRAEQECISVSELLLKAVHCYLTAAEESQAAEERTD